MPYFTKHKLTLHLVCGLTLVLAGILPAQAQNGIAVYLSAPKSQTSAFTDIVTETFEEFSTGVYTSSLTGTIGTYQLSNTIKLAIVGDNQYSAGTGQYAAVGVQSGSSAPVTLQLNGQHSYFGFSWNAGDRNNELSFYNGNQLVGYYSTATVTKILKNPTITTLDNQTYQSSDYYGQPSTGQNRSEPYAFINFIDTGGSFDKIVFANSNSSGTGFESDNHTVRVLTPTPLDSFVQVGTANTPEPGSMALLFALSTGSCMFALKRRKRH